MDETARTCSTHVWRRGLSPWGKDGLLILLIAALGFQAEGAAAPAPAQKAKIRGNPAKWFGANYYPAEAKAARKQGLVATILRVDEQGAIAECKISQSSGFDPLDRGTCDLIVEHLSFSPAKDDTGRPVATDYPLRVTWYLGD
jgi:protein TonB